MQAKTIIIWDANEIPDQCSDAARFRHFCVRAKAAGASHVTIGQIPASDWQKADERDPHPQWDSWPVWSRRNAGIFKLVLPEELAPWLPRQEAETNLALLEERCAILRELGLRAYLDVHEPMWLPEAVFRAHPDWRGAQVECMPLARLPYFSPSTENPRVRDLYRAATTELCRRLPELDILAIFTNDSSCGFEWSHTYPGENGPTAVAAVPLIDRFRAFLTLFQKAAREAGTDLTVTLDNSRLYLDNDHYYWMRLADRQYIDGKGADGSGFAAGSGSNGWFPSGVFPVLGIPRPVAFLRELEQAAASSTPRLKVSFGACADLLIDIHEAFRASPSTGPASRLALLHGIAAARVGNDRAEALLQVWEQIEEAIGTIRHCLRGASLTLVGPLMMRWLTMPLVPEPTRMTATERSNFERGRVARNEAEALDYSCCLGVTGITGRSGADFARLTLSTAINLIRQAAGAATRLADDGHAAEELRLLVRRLRVLEGCLRTSRNFIEYEYVRSSRGPLEEEVWYRDQYATGAINRASYELRLLARAEVDNVLELATLIEEAEAPVIAMAANPSGEDSLTFSPELPAQLRRKAEIMLDHWHEYNQLYPPVPPVVPGL